MTRAQAAVAGRAQRSTRAEPPNQTRAEALVASGLLDVATGIGDVAHSLTDSVIQSIEARMSERGRSAAGAAADVDLLRKAVFEGIAQQLSVRVEQRLKGEPQRHRSNMSSPPLTIATAVARLRPALVTIPAACEYLNISKSSFYERVLPHLDIVHLLPSKPLVKVDCLDRFIAAKTVAARSSNWLTCNSTEMRDHFEVK